MGEEPGQVGKVTEISGCGLIVADIQGNFYKVVDATCCTLLVRSSSYIDRWMAKDYFRLATREETKAFEKELSRIAALYEHQTFKTQ